MNEPPTLNAEIKRQFKFWHETFRAALGVALELHDNAMLKHLAEVSRRHYKNLSAYVDELEVGVDLDPEILALADYFREIAEEIEATLKRKPENDDPSEAWKKG